VFVGLFLCAVQIAFAQGSVSSVQTAEQIAARVDEYMNAAVKADAGVDATFTFERDAGGRVTAILIRNVNGETTKAPKIE
jgi:hypothetical protein